MIDNQRELENEDVINFHAGNDDESDNDISEEDQGICLFKIDKRVFSFRGKQTPAGQYEFPFTFCLPERGSLPSTF